MSNYVCPHCGNPIDDEDALLCLYCGENLERPVGTLGKMRYSTHWMVVAVVTAIALVALFVLFAGCSEAKSDKHADLAGQWYSSSSQDLRAEIEGYLSDANPDKIDGDLIGVIVPHAGFTFSGTVAGYAYKLIKDKNPVKVVIVGFTHRKYFPGNIAVLADESFITPLGRIVIDKDVSQKIIAYDKNIKSIPQAFIAENSVEMQIPFVQIAAPEARVTLIAICDQRPETHKLLAKALYSVLRNEKDFVIAGSTDMSHYLVYDEANKKDEQTIAEITAFDPDRLYTKSAGSNHDLMCGVGAVCAVMEACKRLGANEIDILKYANSGDSSGKKDRVVGYLSAAFIKTKDVGAASPRLRSGQAGREQPEGNMFSELQKKELLKIARDTIKHYLETGARLEVETTDETLKQDMGAFVTLHKKGRLRGCIGSMVASGPIDSTVRDMAIASAVQDPRFPPVSRDEFKNIDIEISALSPMKKIDDHNEIEIGKHGVMVRMGFRSGVYLPQVATETGWNKEEFMNSLCAQKAGIPEDAWKTGTCEIYVFTAEVFGEEE